MNDWEKLHYSVENTETNLAYALVTTAMLYVRDVERRFHQRRIVFIHEKKKMFNDMLDLFRKLKSRQEQLFDNDLVGAICGQGGNYDVWNEDANELARLVLLFAEKCDKNESNKEKVFAFLEALPNGCGLIKKEDVERFKLNR